MNQLFTVSDVQRFSLAMIGRRRSVILAESADFDYSLQWVQAFLRHEVELPEYETSLTREEWISKQKNLLYMFLVWDKHVRDRELGPEYVAGVYSLEIMCTKLIEFVVPLLENMNPCFVSDHKRRRLY